MSDRTFDSIVTAVTLATFSVGQHLGRWLYVWFTSR